MARRAPEGVRLKRLARLMETARRKQCPASAHQKTMCAWTVFATTVPTTIPDVVEVWMVYRLRWQIESTFQNVTEIFALSRFIGSTPEATVFQGNRSRPGESGLIRSGDSGHPRA